VIPVAALAVLTAAPAPLAAQRACDPAVAQSAGEWGAPLDVRVTLHVADVSLRDALDRLTAISKVPLAYSAETLPVDKRVCVAADREPLGALLATLLRGASVKVIVVAGRVVLTPDAVRANNDAVSHSVSVLERVVVTGSAVAAPRRPLTVGMDVIDGAQLRRQELSSLSEILDAAVPGLWSWSQSPSTLVAQYGGVRGASSFGSSSPKIYIDGVEVANPLVVTQINPDVIDRIEVIRGPQGAALYGSDAISGVINVLTRHDGGAVSAPSILFHSTAGAAGSDYVGGLVPTHEQRLTVRAGSNVRSAGLAATFGQTGSLVPSSESRQIAAIGDARLVTARETLNIAARLYDKRSGVGRNPLLAAYIPAAPVTTGSSGPGSVPSPSEPSSTDESQSVRQYTLSTSAAFATEGSWTHTLLAGLDGYSLNNVADAIGPIPTALDSALRAARGSGDRYTLRESSVARFGDGEDALGTITLGVEHSVLRQATTAVTTRKMMPGQQYPTAVDGIVETWNHNTGLLSQVNMTWQQSIFLTGGLRIERNDSFTGNNRYPVLPMVGLAVVRSLGDADVKWRAAYGKGIRPPQTPARSAASGYAGGLGWNGGGMGGVLPALDPEVQTGYEAGVELYLGKALQFQLTRFDQRVTGLIQSVAVAVETFAGRNSTAERRVRYQLQNVGEITNTGWEAQGNFSKGAFMLSSALSSVDSRVRALATGYQGDLQPNDRMLAVPARTGSLTLSWAGDRWTAALGATRAMDWINYDRLTLARDYAAAASTQGAQTTHDFTGALLRTYWRTYDGETHLRLTATRDLSRGIALLVAGENLLGGQLGEPDNVTIRPGRTVTAGLRASF
jgi:iron complex outermembrane receptor protein